MGAMKNFALDTIEGCLTQGRGLTSTARLSVRFTVLGLPTSPTQAAKLARDMGYRVTKRRFTINGKRLTSYWVQRQKKSFWAK